MYQCVIVMEKGFHGLRVHDVKCERLKVSLAIQL